MPRLIAWSDAQRILQACAEEADAVGQPMNIAVVDDGENLVALGRLVVFGGGVLLRDGEGRVAGGVGVSAGTVEEDHRVAEAGRRAYAAA